MISNLIKRKKPMQLTKWEPVNSISNDLYLECLIDNCYCLQLFLELEDSQKFLKIVFDAPLAYKNADEGDLLKNWGGNYPDWSGGSNLFTVENSSYLAWFIEQGYGIRKDEKITHYAIYTPNECVDVLSSCPPEVKWLKTSDISMLKNLTLE